MKASCPDGFWLFIYLNGRPKTVIVIVQQQALQYQPAIRQQNSGHLINISPKLKLMVSVVRK